MDMLLADYLFTIFHWGLILFTLAGWIFAATRKLHLAATGLIMLSWGVLGLRYGFGYCPCTDWHWEVKRSLGERGLPGSFFEYYLDRWFDHGWTRGEIDFVVASAGLLAFGLSIWVNWRDRRS